MDEKDLSFRVGLNQILSCSCQIVLQLGRKLYYGVRANFGWIRRASSFIMGRLDHERRSYSAAVKI